MEGEAEEEDERRLRFPRLRRLKVKEDLSAIASSYEGSPSQLDGRGGDGEKEARPCDRRASSGIESSERPREWLELAWFTKVLSRVVRRRSCDWMSLRVLSKEEGEV